jgi:multidrug efflux pump subunit AcrA (membrane-fusion protein)
MKHDFLRRPLASALAGAIAGTLLLGGCTFGQAPEPTPIPLLVSPAGAALAAARPHYTVQRGEVVDTMTFSAEVTQAKMEDLFFATNGRVQEVYVQSGETVALDQVIALLDTRLLELDREAAAAELKLAQQRLALAEVKLRFDTLQRQLNLQAEQLRLERLQKDPTAARLARTLQELAVHQAELALQQLESGVEPGTAAEVVQAEIALRKVETMLADAQISAPFGGQVLLYDALEKGKVVQAYTPVAALVNPSELLLQATLVPADLQALHEGMAVEIELRGGADGLPGPRLPGIVRMLPQPFGTGAGPAVLIAPGDATARHQLRPGATVQIHAPRAEAANALWLPPDAVQGYAGNYFVRLPDGVEQAVKVGIFGSERVEIVGGLAFGAEVVGD